MLFVIGLCGLIWLGMSCFMLTCRGITRHDDKEYVNMNIVQLNMFVRHVSGFYHNVLR